MLQSIFSDSSLLIPVGLLVSFLILVSVLKGKLKGSGKQYKYERLPALFTPTERSFYQVLCKVVQIKALIFGKVRVSDILQVKNGSSKADFHPAFRKISAKYFDFVLCDPRNMSVIAGIELDDSSHDSKTR